MPFDNAHSFPWGPIVWILSVVTLYQLFASLVVYHTEPPFFIWKAQKQREKGLKHGPNRLRAVLTAFAAVTLVCALYVSAGPLLHGTVLARIPGSIAASIGFSGFVWVSVKGYLYRLNRVLTGLLAVGVGIGYGLPLVLTDPSWWWVDGLAACYVCFPILYLCRGIKAQTLVGLLLGLIASDVIRNFGNATSVALPGISIYNLPVPMTLASDAQALLHINWATLLMGAVINLVGMRATKRQGSTLYTSLTAIGTVAGFFLALLANMTKLPLPASLFVVGGACAGYLSGHAVERIGRAIENRLGQEKRADQIVLLPSRNDYDLYYLTLRYLEERRRGYG